MPLVRGSIIELWHFFGTWDLELGISFSLMRKHHSAKGHACGGEPEMRYRAPTAGILHLLPAALPPSV